MTSQFFVVVPRRMARQHDTNQAYFTKCLRGRLVGDSGYDGEPDKVSITLSGHSPQTKELFARIKLRGESHFRHYKSLNIMGGAPF
jgi:hypothetical protein